MGKGSRCVRLKTLPPSCTVVKKSESLNFQEQSGPVHSGYRCCATNGKVAGSTPAGVGGFFIDIKSIPIALWPWD